jgi:hypothetical protein
VTCPVCDDGNVKRLPSARVNVPKGRPNVPKGQGNVPNGHAASGAPSAGPSATAPSPVAAPSPAAAEAMAGLPPELLGTLREIVKRTENVGTRFPEEARKIHYEEVPPRPIRGQASPEEAKALNDEGIEFSSLPPFLMPDQH